jgi:hypothetical protein
MANATETWVYTTHHADSLTKKLHSFYGQLSAEEQVLMRDVLSRSAKAASTAEPRRAFKSLAGGASLSEATIREALSVTW